MNDNKGPLIKICGITREQDAELAIRHGASALGLNFYDSSPRFVDLATAARISANIGNRALKVGLFVDATGEQVMTVLDKVALDVLQFHGNEAPAFCSQFGRPWWKAFRVRSADELTRQLQGYEEAAALLLDAWHPDMHGGTGTRFDWSVLEHVNHQQPVVLAGGLNPDNVAEAVQKVQPWGVDVSSGVEESPGVKSEALMKAFIDEVHSVRK